MSPLTLWHPCILTSLLLQSGLHNNRPSYQLQGGNDAVSQWVCFFHEWAVVRDKAQITTARHSINPRIRPSLWPQLSLSLS